MKPEYAGSSVWDNRFDREGDLDWGGLWTDPFVGLLRTRQVKDVLDLGCGTGADVARLAAAGFRATGIDFSTRALAIARNKGIEDANFLAADMAQPLPLQSESFDAVFSNVSLHMFDDPTTGLIVSEVARILRRHGQFIFHVNSDADRALRARRRPVFEELSDNRIREQDGQTVHFFTADELGVLFQGWENLQLQHLEIPDRKTGAPFKMVWRGIARTTIDALANS